MTPDDRHRQRLELVLEGTRLGMWDWNPQTNAVVFDERWAQMLGYELSEIPFELASWQSRVHPDDLASCFEDITAHMEGRVPFYENVHRMRHKDGHWVWILDRGRICEWDDEGRPIRFTGTHTDITPQKEAEARALDLAAGRTHFLATMSHEIRTPMHGMLGLLDLLSQTGLDTQQRALIEVIRRSGESLTCLVDDVLDFAKATSGGIELVLEPFDLHALLGAVRALYAARAEARDLSLELSIDEAVPRWVRGDRQRIQQILNNLVSNALKFTDQGGVSIEAALGSGGVRIQVRDSGQGIDDVSRIFKPYDQGARGARRGGTGLGLAIVRELVDAMGGTVSAASVVGEGSSFAITLPLPECSEATTREPSLSGEGLERSLRILVADDNPVNQLVLKGMLDGQGHLLTIVGGAADARRALLFGAFDVALLDIDLGDGSGHAVARSIREARLGLPLVAVTADVMPDSVRACEASGFDAFLAKPFDRTRLFRTLAQVSRDVEECAAK